MQRPYYDSAINRLATHSAPLAFPADPNCPNPVDETPNCADRFQPGATAYFVAYYRDKLAGQVTRYSILRPSGSVFSSWTGSSLQPYYSSSYWYWWYTPCPATRRRTCGTSA